MTTNQQCYKQLLDCVRSKFNNIVNQYLTILKLYSISPQDFITKITCQGFLYFLFIIIIYLLISLAASGLKFGTWDLWSSLQQAGSQLQQAALFLAACGISCSLTGDQTQAPCMWEPGVLAIGPPAKSHILPIYY